MASANRTGQYSSRRSVTGQASGGAGVRIHVCLTLFKLWAFFTTVGLLHLNHQGSRLQTQIPGLCPRSSDSEDRAQDSAVLLRSLGDCEAQEFMFEPYRPAYSRLPGRASLVAQW